MLLAGAAVFLNIAARKQSVKSLVTMTVVLLGPLASIVVPPAIKAYGALPRREGCEARRRQLARAVGRLLSR
jgi:hypothetical protein